MYRKIYEVIKKATLACLVIAKKEFSFDVTDIIEKQLMSDTLDHTMRFIAEKENLYDIMDSDALQTCLDRVVSKV